MVVENCATFNAAILFKTYYELSYAKTKKVKILNIFKMIKIFWNKGWVTIFIYKNNENIFIER